MVVRKGKAEPKSDFFYGLDLGQSVDYTAGALVQRVPIYDETTGKWDFELHLRHLERFPLKTPYPDIADDVTEYVRDLAEEIIEEGEGFMRTRRRARVELVVDRTGVGGGVTALFDERKLYHVDVTIRPMGEETKKTGTRKYNVTKPDLVAALEIPWQNGKLWIADELELKPVLVDELMKFRRKQNPKTAHVTFEHWRSSDHDDLVLAAALACWKATYERKGTTKLRVIY